MAKTWVVKTRETVERSYLVSAHDTYQAQEQVEGHMVMGRRETAAHIEEILSVQEAVLEDGKVMNA